MAIQVTRVAEGDIIEADQSWRINSILPSDHSQLDVGQNFRQVVDTSSPQYHVSESLFSLGQQVTTYPSEYFVETNGPEFEDGSGIIINGNAVPISEIGAAEGISVRGKNFVVTSVEKTAWYESCDRRITAQESTPEGLIKPKGLTVQFQQVAPFGLDPALYAEPKPHAGHYYIHDVKVVGKLALPKK